MERSFSGRIGLVATSWPLVASLIALLLNDHLLKAAYPGWVTGKLSDFAGILLVALFAMAAFPRRTLLVAAAICAAFVWWKSPASEPFIRMVSTVYPIGRTVDYTDLIAFAVLPLAVRVAQGLERFQLPSCRLRRLATAPILLVSAFAVMATGIPQYTDRFSIRAIGGVWPLETSVVNDAIRAAAARSGMKCSDCGAAVTTGWYGRENLGLKYEILGAGGVSFVVSGTSDSDFLGLFGDSTPGRMRKLREDIKREFTSRANNLEFAAPLGGSLIFD